MVCGKNTMMKKAIMQLNTQPSLRNSPYTGEESEDAAWTHQPHLDLVCEQLRGNTSIIFSNDDLVDILAIFSKGVANATAVSLGSGYVVRSAVPHLIMRAFKNLAAVTFSSDSSFPQAEALKAAAAAGPATASAGAGAAAAKEEVVEEEEEDMER